MAARQNFTIFQDSENVAPHQHGAIARKQGLSQPPSKLSVRAACTRSRAPLSSIQTVGEIWSGKCEENVKAEAIAPPPPTDRECVERVENKENDISMVNVSAPHTYRPASGDFEEDTEDVEIQDDEVILGSSESDRAVQQVEGNGKWTGISDLNSTQDDRSLEVYLPETIKYLREVEVRHMCKWNYMSKQPDITFAMRSILVDWLVEVGEEYKLESETLYLAVNFIDRFLSFMSVQRAKLQLVGTACMFIAAKYEEIYPPDVGEFVYITDDTYNKKQVLRMEHLVLKVLNFDLAVPTSLFFVNLFSQAAESNAESKFLAQYLSELTLMEGETFLSFANSHIGASAVALARHTLRMPAWPEEMVQLSGLTIDDLKPCLVCLHEVFTKAPSHPQQAIREKYKQSRFRHVADTLPTPIF